MILLSFRPSVVVVAVRSQVSPLFIGFGVFLFLVRARRPVTFFSYSFLLLC